jgi:hypothetical protein
LDVIVGWATRNVATYVIRRREAYVYESYNYQQKTQCDGYDFEQAFKSNPTL